MSTYIPSQHSPTSKPLGISSPSPTDARTYYYDTTVFRRRPFQSIQEVLTYLPTAAMRTGHTAIVINIGGIVDYSSPTGFTGGVFKEFWFKDGLAEEHLVMKNEEFATVDYVNQTMADVNQSSYELPIAAQEILGGIRAGDGLAVDPATGVASVAPIQLSNLGLSGFLLLTKGQAHELIQKRIFEGTGMEIVENAEGIYLQVKETYFSQFIRKATYDTLTGTTWNLDATPKRIITLTGNTSLTTTGTAGLSEGFLIVINPASHTLSINGVQQVIKNNDRTRLVLHYLPTGIYYSSDASVGAAAPPPPENINPPAPTGGVVDNNVDTFTFTPATGYLTTEHEYRINTGPWTNVTSATINVGDIAIPIGGLEVRVKAGTGRNAGPVLTNAQAFTVATVTPPPPPPPPPTGFTAGLELSASFTAPDGTSIDSYVPEVGVNISLWDGSAVITGGRVITTGTAKTSASIEADDARVRMSAGRSGANGYIGIYIRMQDANNYILIYTDQTGTYVLEKYLGTFLTLHQDTFKITDNNLHEFEVVYAEDMIHSIKIDGTTRFTNVLFNPNLAPNTNIGFRVDDGFVDWFTADEVAYYIVKDTFTGANGTVLTDRQPETGTAWSMVHSPSEVAILEDGKVITSSVAGAWITQNIGVADCRLLYVLNKTALTGIVRIYLRLTDTSNLLEVRFDADDTMKLISIVDGVETIFANSSAVLNDTNDHSFLVTAIGNTLSVFKDGEAYATASGTIPANHTGTHAGIVLNQTVRLSRFEATRSTITFI